MHEEFEVAKQKMKDENIWGKDGEFPPKKDPNRAKQNAKKAWGSVKKMTTVKESKISDRMLKLEQLNDKSAKGDPQAQYELAVLYHFGKLGLEVNVEKVMVGHT